ncbi:hypothetical protein BT96DRAFT_986296 [Gymnopus androsaceus JB14]|uniref:Uncharacterized protein n=1 Tax=Gymnopus androsaceus JB14 TaxID=1447944 RepID=A0A6A4IFT6_9AGAR|nr:hypothetical protein BT96DRAFT_986296 [Gymnopus androsaceus JB14]
MPPKATDQSQIETYLTTLAKRCRNLEYNVKEDGSKKMIYECAIALGDFLASLTTTYLILAFADFNLLLFFKTSTVNISQMVNTEVLYTAYGDAVKHLKSVQDMEDMPKINSYHKTNEFYTHLGSLRNKPKAKPKKRSEPKSKEVIEDSDSSDDEVKEVDPTDPDTNLTWYIFYQMKDSTTQSSALSKLKFSKGASAGTSSKEGIAIDQNGRLSMVRLHYSDIPGMAVEAPVCHWANYYLMKAAAPPSTEGFTSITSYVSPLKRPRCSKDPRVLFRPETEGEQFNSPSIHPASMSLYETLVVHHGYQLGYANFLDELGLNWEAILAWLSMVKSVEQQVRPNAEYKEAYNQQLNAEVNMIAGYPEPDYATLHNDVLQSLNNCHCLDWIHHHAMAYYDCQAAQSAWDLYQFTNAIMFDRGLKIR